MEWLKQQGPWCPALHRLPRSGTTSSTTRWSSSPTCTRRPCSACASRRPSSILVPTAHDEPAIHLEIYKEMFAPAGGRRLQHRRRAQVPDDALPDPRDRGGDGRLRRRPARAGRQGAGPPTTTSPLGRGRRPPVRRYDDYQPLPPHIAERGAVFRRRHRLHGPFALYGGRIDPGKGCEELIEYFSGYVGRRRRRVARADGRQADEAARRAVPPLRRPALGARAPAGARGRHRRRRAVALREPVAARARGVRRRHAGAGQRAQRGAGRPLRAEQRGPVLRRSRRVRRGADAAAWATPRCAPRWDGTAASTCAGTTGGT